VLDPLIQLKVIVQGFTLSGFARNLQYRLQGSPDRLPIPPAHLLYLVIGSIDVRLFLESGRVHADRLIQGTLQKNGFAMDEFKSVLDFGCGCGRIMRYWASLNKVSLYGVDYNSKLIKWCRRNLPFADYQVNKLLPPLGYESEKFDFVYVRSVFTHLPQTLQLEWLKEFRRILKPNGVLLFTVSGRAYYSWMTDDEKERYDAGQLVVREQDQAGKNLCAVFHPEEWVSNQVAQSGYALVDFIPGKTVEYFYQDTYLVQKRDMPHIESSAK
jgi:SAM-dependent methyltransferase